MLSESKLQKYRAKLPSSLFSLTAECKKIIGIKVKQARKRAGLTQQDVADILDVDPKTIQRIEQGKFNSIQLSSFYNLAAIFECSVTEFLPEDLVRLSNPLATLNTDSLQSLIGLALGEQNRRITT